MSSTAPDTAVLVLTTLAADADADAMARTLVAERLAACVNVLPVMTSHYRWKDAVEQATERQLLIKTTAGRVETLRARLIQLHPYEVPEFLVIDVAGGSKGYLQWLREAVLMVTAILMGAATASAQSPVPFHTGPAVAAEALVGWAGFLDDSTIHHVAAGGSARMQIGSRFSVGPELTYMRGPGGDRDLFVTGNVTYDFAAQAPGYPPRVNPYLVAGVGGFRHSDRFGAATVSSWEGTVTAGGGVRVMLTERVYAVGEARLGWEPHLRILGGIGIVAR